MFYLCVWRHGIHFINQSAGCKWKNMVRWNLCVGGLWSTLRKSLFPLRRALQHLVCSEPPPAFSHLYTHPHAQGAQPKWQLDTICRSWDGEDEDKPCSKIFIKLGIWWQGLENPDFRELRDVLCCSSATSQCGCLTLPSLESLFTYFLMSFYKVSSLMIFFEKKEVPFQFLFKILRSVEEMESD